MTLTLSVADWRHLWQESWQNARLSASANNSDLIAPCPQLLAQGYKRNIELRNGILLTLHNYEFFNNIEIIKPEPSQEYCLEFVFNFTSRYQRFDGYTVGDGQSYLQGMLVPEGTSIDYSGRRLAVDIHLDPHLLESLCAGQIASLSPELKRMIEGDESLPFLPCTTTPEIEVALQSILNCPYQEPIRQMYLEAKTLEVIALQLELMVAEHQQPKKFVKLGRDDIDRIHHAKEILTQHLNNPPSLTGLAQQVGLNDRKLKEGFRQVFNTTAFGYLHDCRMERARQLLQQEMTVAGVAAAVGYASPTAFNAAFRRKFGINPKRYQLSTQGVGGCRSLPISV
jgi:AraC family transcriptional activator of pyochelin receptor